MNALTHDEVNLVLSEAVDVQALLDRAIAKRNQAIQAERERVEAIRQAQIRAAQEEVALALAVYQGSVKDGLKAAYDRQKETRYLPNDIEKAMATDEIPFDANKIRSTTWRYFPEFYSFQIRLAREKLRMARQKLKKLL